MRDGLLTVLIVGGGLLLLFILAVLSGGPSRGHASSADPVLELPRVSGRRHTTKEFPHA